MTKPPEKSKVVRKLPGAVYTRKTLRGRPEQAALEPFQISWSEQKNIFSDT